MPDALLPPRPADLPPATSTGGRPLRVLHLDSGREWRAAQRQLLLLVDGERAAAVEPVVVAPPRTPLLRRARAAGQAASALPVLGPWDLNAARRLRRLLRTWRPDLVHAHDARAHAVALVALLGRRTPLVVTRRPATPPAPTEVPFAARVARFVTPTRAARATLLDAGVPADRVDVVPPAVAPRPADAPRRDWRAERGWPADALVVGVVGWADDADAPALAALLEALTAAAGPAVAGRVHVVRFGGPGAGAEALAGVACARAGLVDDMAAALAGLDLLWHLPPRGHLGMAALEAMALGVPVVAVPSGGLEELVVAGEEVVLVAPGDHGASAGAGRDDPTLPARLARATAPLLCDAPRRAAFAAAGRAAARRFAPERMVAGVAATHARALGQR